MIEQRVRRPTLLRRFVQIFDPSLAFVGLGLNLYLEIYLLVISSQSEVVVSSILGILTCVLIYISILSSYSIFKTFIDNHKTLSYFLCCYLSKKIKEKFTKYKFKYIITIIAVSIAIAVSVLSANLIQNLKQQANDDQVQIDSNKTLIFFVLLHCIGFWLLSLYQASIACLKIIILLLFGILCWPCIIVYLYKYGDNETENSEITNEDIAINNNGDQQPPKKTIKDLSKRELRKFLKIGFFRRKRNGVASLQPQQQSCAICLEQFVDNQDIIQLNCNEGHLFHFRCLQSWVTRQQNCPLCRKDLIDEQLVQEIVMKIKDNIDSERDGKNEHKSLNDSQKIGLKYLELNPKNLKHLPIEEQKQILQAFNISFFDGSNMNDQTIRVQEMSLSRDFLIEENQRNNLSRLSRNPNNNTNNNNQVDSDGTNNNGNRRPMKGRKAKKKKKKSFNRNEMISISPIPHNNSIHVINEEEAEHNPQPTGRNMQSFGQLPGMLSNRRAASSNVLSSRKPSTNLRSNRNQTVDQQHNEQSNHDIQEEESKQEIIEEESKHDQEVQIIHQRHQRKKIVKQQSGQKLKTPQRRRRRQQQSSPSSSSSVDDSSSDDDDDDDDDDDSSY